MLITVYAYPTADKSFQDEILFRTDEFVSYEYEKHWAKKGSFTIVFPVNKKTLMITENCVINSGDDWLFVDDVKRTAVSITVTGYDLKSWLDLRITVFGKEQVAGAAGYDVIKGTTGECINHYINNNAVNPTDSNRKFPRLFIGQTAQGKAEDSYMARLEVLESVIDTLCVNSTIGYEIIGDIDNNRYIFNTLAGTDRSIEQSENPVVIFSEKRNNLNSSTFERGHTDLLNAIYATGADVTQLVTRDNEIPSGILRRETAIDVSVSTVADIKLYALNQTSGNILTNTYELDISTLNDYGVKYNIGDYVTVKDVVTNKTWTAQIVAVKKSYSQSAQSIVLTLGDAKMKLLNKIQNTVTINNISESNKVYNSISDVVSNATSLITGAKGGYVVIHTNDTGQPYEILIMDTDDIETAKSVWRWNSGGFGYSSNGYGGPYTTAITMDGKIVADFITAGGMNAERITAGTLQGIKIVATTGSIAGWEMKDGVLVSSDGSMKLDSVNNTLSVYDSNGQLKMQVNQQGVRYYQDGEYLGFIGTNRIVDTEYRGLYFNLDLKGDHMSWAVKEEEGGNYMMKLTYYRQCEAHEKGFVFNDNLKINGNVAINGTLTVNGQPIG